MNSINRKVYIGSMNMRGKWASFPNNSKRINVTSSQSKYRLAFSQMPPIWAWLYYCCNNFWD